MFRFITGVGLGFVLICSPYSACGQTPKYTSQTISVPNAASTPYTVNVGDVVQLTLPNQNVGGLPTSTIVANSGNGLSPFGAIALDATASPGTYIAFYSVVALGGSTVTFTYTDTSGGTSKTVTKTLLFDVPATGVASIWDLNANTSTPASLPNVKVGDVIRLTYTATSATQTIISSVLPNSVGLTLNGQTFNGTTYVAFFAATQPGSATIVFDATNSTGTLTRVTITAPMPPSR
jgi:hypothetical protein